MISIGAQVMETNFQVMLYHFQNYNSGLKDRIVPEKSSYTPKSSNSDEE